MAVIFLFSMQNGEESSTFSNQVILFLENLTGVNLFDNERFPLDTIQFIVRKAAHMSEYAILAMLLYMFFKESGYRDAFLVALMGSMIYACTDEFHQLFSVGRSGRWQDVGIDTAGAFLGLCLQQGIFIYMQKYKKRKKGIDK